MSTVLEKILRIGELAGITGKQVGDLLSYHFDLDNDRSQDVWVGRYDDYDTGLDVICFVSPCQRLGTHFLNRMSKSQAQDLLKLNAQYPFGHYCVMTIGEEEMLCARNTQILNTMDVEEFKAHCYSVAKMADAWEERIGRDEF